jgi:hypothetical protein
MTEADLARIEATLGVVLPPRYREFALGLPNSWDDESANDWYCFWEVDQIIQSNLELRQGGLIKGWKPELFCIGDFEDGHFFIDLTDLDKGLFFDYHRSGCGLMGGLFSPEDYSSCRVQSWEEFTRQTPRA